MYLLLWHTLLLSNPQLPSSPVHSVAVKPSTTFFSGTLCSCQTLIYLLLRYTLLLTNPQLPSSPVHSVVNKPSTTFFSGSVHSHFEASFPHGHKKASNRQGELEGILRGDDQDILALQGYIRQQFLFWNKTAPTS